MKVIFTPEAFKKFKAYIHGCPVEISGFGKVVKRGEDLVIEDVKIFQQVVTSAHTVIDAMASAKFFDDLIVAGEDPGLWKLWWHSHVYMSAQFSSTDFDTIDDFDLEMPEENWMLSIVANKLGKLLARVDIFEPIRCTINDIAWDISFGDIDLEVDVAAEISEKVTIRNEAPQQSITWQMPPRVNLQKRRVLTEEEVQRLQKQFPNLHAENMLPNAIQDAEIIFEET